MIYKKLINYIISNGNKLPEGETWFSLGLKFNIEIPNKNRAKKDKKYYKKAIATKTQDIWRNHLKQKEKLKLDKEIYVDGKLKFETFKNKPEEVKYDETKYEIEKLTTNPYGGAWLKLKKREILTEDHLKDLKQILSNEVTKINLNKDLSTNDKSLFIYSSDKHIGALTKENSIYTNKYTEDEMYKRIVINTLNIIKEKVKELGKFESLFVMDLGDALDGFNNKTTNGLKGNSSHTLPQQYNNREQFDLYLKFQKDLFDNIVINDFAKNIYFIATSNSNHGGDFEYTAMKAVELYLNIKYPFIKTVINHRPINHFIYGKHCIIFGHGKDDEDMKNGLPLTLNPKVENFIADYIRINKLNDYYITFVSGDLHQSAETYGKNFRYKKVLSQYGGSKWIHTNFGSSTPGLSIEIFNKDKNNIQKEDVFFNSNNISNTGIKF